MSPAPGNISTPIRAVCIYFGREMHLKELLHEIFNTGTVALYLALPLVHLVAYVGRGAELKVVIGSIGVDIYGAGADGCPMASLTTPGVGMSSGDSMERVTKSSVNPLRALGARLPSSTVVATYLGMGFWALSPTVAFSPSDVGLYSCRETALLSTGCSAR